MQWICIVGMILGCVWVCRTMGSGESITCICGFIVSLINGKRPGCKLLAAALRTRHIHVHACIGAPCVLHTSSCSHHFQDAPVVETHHVARQLQCLLPSAVQVSCGNPWRFFRLLGSAVCLVRCGVTKTLQALLFMWCCILNFTESYRLCSAWCW